MKKYLNLIFRGITVAFSTFNLLMFFAMRPCWSGISKTLNYETNQSWWVLNLPILICILLALIFLASVVLSIVCKNKKGWIIGFLITDFILLIAIIAIIILGAADYMLYIWRNFGVSMIYVGIISVLLFFLFIYPKTPLVNSKAFKLTLVGLSICAAGAGLTNVCINYFTYEPVVWAVEDTYQIVFSSNADSIAWVEVGENKYFDDFSGSAKSFTKIHKCVVPMSSLDSEGEYKVNIQQAIYRGPFGGIMGDTISKKYSFKPVDTSDGLSYFGISDVHNQINAGIKAGLSVENLDFLVVEGDTSSYLQTEEDANMANKLAFGITQGTIPCVYSRGNHECKGEYAEELYKYVGSKNEKFYYTFKFNNVYGINLDLAEDHDDGWWEYYGTDDFDTYRQEQLDFINAELQSKEYESYPYRLALCHIPVVFVNYRLDHQTWKNEFTIQLNKMGIDMMLSGHQHELMIFEPGLIESHSTLYYNTKYKTNADGSAAKYSSKGYLTDFNFPNLLVSKPGHTMAKNESNESHIGMHVKVDAGFTKEVVTYYDSKQNRVDLYNIFAEVDYGEELTINLDTKQFSRK